MERSKISSCITQRPVQHRLQIARDWHQVPKSSPDWKEAVVSVIGCLAWSACTLGSRAQWYTVVTTLVEGGSQQLYYSHCTKEEYCHQAEWQKCKSAFKNTVSTISKWITTHTTRLKARAQKPQCDTAARQDTAAGKSEVMSHATQRLVQLRLQIICTHTHTKKRENTHWQSIKMETCCIHHPWP